MSRQRVARKPKSELHGETPAVEQPSVLPLSGWLLSAALVLAAVGGGILYDRVMAGGVAGPFELIGTPLCAILVSLGVMVMLWHPREKRFEGAGGIPIAGWIGTAFLAWCALSLVRSSTLHASLTALAILALGFAGGFVAHRTGTDLRRRLILAAVLSGAATLVSILGVNEYLQELRGGNALWRVFAGFVNPDFLAGYLVMAVPVSVALLLAVRHPFARTAAGIAVLLQAACLALTQSRLGLLTLIASLVFFGVMAVRGRLLSPLARRICILAAAILVVGIVVAGRPLLRRLVSSGQESYSARFRTETWKGTLRMAAANPVLGTGIGTFEPAYSKYATVGYTQHAHNAYVQLAGETGFPGVLLLAATVGLAIWAGSMAVVKVPVGEGEPDPSSRILTAGLVAGIAAAALHNLADSDFYVPANSLSLGVLMGLALSGASGRRTAQWAPMAATAGAGLLGAFSVMVLLGRVAANGAEVEMAKAHVDDPLATVEQVIQAYRDAAARDPLNPEYHLRLAGVLERAGRMAEAESASRQATELAPVGKTFYRYGRQLTREGKTAEAVSWHERARNVEPNNLDNLLALADAYAGTGKLADAEAVWRQMMELYNSDFARIRAVPEMIEWQYGRAYQRLGETELVRGDATKAAELLKEAVAILGTFWKQRDLLIAQIRIRQEERNRTADYYADSLRSYAKALEKLGKRAEQKAVEVTLAELDTERNAPPPDAKVDADHQP